MDNLTGAEGEIPKESFDKILEQIKELKNQQTGFEPIGDVYDQILKRREEKKEQTQKWLFEKQKEEFERKQVLGEKYLETKFKETVEYKPQISPQEFNEKYKNILPNPEEFKNLEFNHSLTELGYDIDNIFDSKIKEKIKKLLDKDRILRQKEQAKFHKQALKENLKRWPKGKSMKQIEKLLNKSLKQE